MAVEITLNTPLAEGLNAVIQPKLVDVGWSTGGVDDSALSEYIILMLVNGKTQDQIAAELSGDLLNLGPDDPGAIDFSRWLFEQVELLHKELNGGLLQTGTSAPDYPGDDPARLGGAKTESSMGGHDGGPSGQDIEMSNGQSRSLEGNIPTGPKSMRNGNKRLFGHLSRAMDRSHDNVLHRVRPQSGTERINTHSREPPKGPRNGQNRNQRTPSSRNFGAPHTAPSPNGVPGATLMAMSPQQQMQLFAMYEEQARMMAQILSPQQQQQVFMGQGYGAPVGHGGFGQTSPVQPQTPGRSLFERVEPRIQNGDGPAFRKQSTGRFAPQHSLGRGSYEGGQSSPDPSSSMDVDALQENRDGDPATTICKFNMACAKQDCPFAHQSPAAPPGTTIDVNDECPFGAACKNRKCVARHPSPALKTIHQADQECKYFPNCTNPACPFRHPTMPLCRSGADCTRPGCKFTHVKTACKYNPCLNPTCPFKHAEGQKRGAFHDKVWVADGVKNGGHVSERKFVDETGAEEELIIPTNSAPSSQVGAELTT